MNKIDIAIFVIGSIVGYLYARHLNNRRKALRRLKRISHLWQLPDGVINALELYEEASVLWYQFGFVPDDFGYSDWDDIRETAMNSLSRYIQTMDMIYTENFSEYRELSRSAVSKAKTTKINDQYSPLRDAGHKLADTLAATREKLNEFRALHDEVPT